MLNKKMLLSVLIIGVVAAAAGAGTWAAWDDYEYAASTITTGDLNLTLNGGDTDTVTLNINSVNNAKPGDNNKSVDNILLENDGSIDGKLYVNVTNIVSNGNGIENDAELAAESNDATADDGTNTGELDTWLTLYFYNGAYDATKVPLYSVDMDQSYSGDLSLDEAFASGDTLDLYITYSIDGDADNTCQGDSVTFDLVFLLDQDMS